MDGVLIVTRMPTGNTIRSILAGIYSHAADCATYEARGIYSWQSKCMYT